MGASTHYSDAIKAMMRALTEDRTGDLEAAQRALREAELAIKAWRESADERIRRRRVVLRDRLQRAGVLSADDV